jgi:hypothetical protein
MIRSRWLAGGLVLLGCGAPPPELTVEATPASAIVRAAEAATITVTFKNKGATPIEFTSAFGLRGHSFGRFDVRSLAGSSRETTLRFVPADAKGAVWSCGSLDALGGARPGDAAFSGVLAATAKEPAEPWTHVVLLPHGKARISGQFLAVGCANKAVQGRFAVGAEQKLPRGRYKVRIKTPLVWPATDEHPELEPTMVINVVP